MTSTQQMFSDGKAGGEGQAKADEVLQPVADKASDAAQSAHESSEKATGFLQQTGEQVMHVAREAANAVGMGTTDASSTGGDHHRHHQAEVIGDLDRDWVCGKLPTDAMKVIQLLF